jgi:hypothetical protein
MKHGSIKPVLSNRAHRNRPPTPGNWGVGIKCRKPFGGETTIIIIIKIRPSRTREMLTMYFIGFLLYLFAFANTAGFGSQAVPARRDPGDPLPTYRGVP